MASPDATRPTARLRRSFVYRILEHAGARFAEVNGAAVAMSFGAVADEIAAARNMGLADLSPLARVGFKGRGAIAWTRAQGVEIGDANNAAAVQSDGALAARLADTEVLVIDGLDGAGSSPHRLESEWRADDPPSVYLVNRQSANFWFLVSGAYAAEMFAKLCAVDLRPIKFPSGAVVQTSIARTNCIAIRGDLGDVPVWHVLGDSASAEYQWGCLIDAMNEFGGRPVGLDALRQPGATSAQP